jgi:hypothetical protein
MRCVQPLAVFGEGVRRRRCGVELATGARVPVLQWVVQVRCNDCVPLFRLSFGVEPLS